MNPRTAGIFVFENFQLLDAAGPASVFETASQLSGHPVTVRLLALGGGAVRSSCGIDMLTHDAHAASALDTLIVAGGAGVPAILPSAAAFDFVKSAARRARRIASVCSGALILAHAGLLDGRHATTHWTGSEAFIATYGRVRLKPGHIFIKDGNVWTSGGVCAGIDLALAMVAEDFGETVASATARHLVVYHRRSGVQPQISALLELQSPTGRFGALTTWMREHLDQPLGVERLASQMHMSARHFTRTFTAQTGTSPGKAVEKLRAEAAKARVEADDAPFEKVARACGFGDAEQMRRAFLRVFGQPPQALRKAAREELHERGAGRGSIWH